MHAVTSKAWTLPDERWLPVVGYEGQYLVSDWGRVWSVPRRARTALGDRYVRGRFLSQTLTEYGHWRVHLSGRGIRGRTSKVHQLVAEAFLGPRPPGLEVCHGPGGRRDNRLANLCWGTKSKNMLDKHRDGTDHCANRERCPIGHLLELPNLVAAALRRGARNCLACGRGRATVLNARRAGGPDLDYRVEADRHYRLIMGDAA